MEKINELISMLDFFSPEILPPCGIYGRLIPCISYLRRITANEAREIYGLFTVGEWIYLLQQVEQQNSKITNKKV